MKNFLTMIMLAHIVLGCKTNSSENQKTTTMETQTMEFTIKQEQKAIENVLVQLFEATDNRDWNAVKTTMHDSVYFDYTALGHEAAFKTPDEILANWKQLLPGFERTVHQPHNFAVWVADNRATATLDVIATHFLENDFWTVFVGYDTEFIKEDDQWKLARIDLSLYDQTGNTQLPEKALENVKNETIPSLVTAKNVTALETFFTSLENQNLEGLLS